jgi:hypothetical protein
MNFPRGTFSGLGRTEGLAREQLSCLGHQRKGNPAHTQERPEQMAVRRPNTRRRTLYLF